MSENIESEPKNTQSQKENKLITKKNNKKRKLKNQNRKRGLDWSAQSSLRAWNLSLSFSQIFGIPKISLTSLPDPAIVVELGIQREGENDNDTVLDRVDDVLQLWLALRVWPTP